MEIKKEDIKKDLIEQLNSNGIFASHYMDLINDYMEMWEIKNHLIKDIRERGVTTEYKNGENQYGYKRNDSIPELNKINGQMLKILNDLGLKATDVEVIDVNDEL